ncbi:MAG: hypothetical protein ACTSUT_03125 [Promethearchaeota archaeon]
MIKDIEKIINKPINKAVKEIDYINNFDLYYNNLINLIKNKKLEGSYHLENEILTIKYNNFNCSILFDYYNFYMLVKRIKKNKSAFSELKNDVKKPSVKRIYKKKNTNLAKKRVKKLTTLEIWYRKTA